MQPEKAFVFGLGPAGLFLSRTLNRAGFQVYGIAREDDIGRYSNSLTDCFVGTDVVQAAAWAKEIVANSSRARGFIASDQYLTSIVGHRDAVERIMFFADPSLETLIKLNEKSIANQVMLDCGMRLPSKVRLDEALTEGFVAFPAAVKPQVKILDSAESVVGKIKVLNNKVELDGLCAQLLDKGCCLSDFTCETYIAGDNSYEFGYGGYFQNGEPVAELAVIQFRQYPQGVACAALEINSGRDFKELRHQASLFSKGLNYTGFLQFDMKKDKNTDEVYVLDANPRVWGSVGILGRKYVNLEEIFKENPSSLTKISSPLYWHSPLKEILSRRVPNNSGMKITKGYKRILDLYDPNDKKPFYMQLVVGFKKVLKK